MMIQKPLVVISALLAGAAALAQQATPAQKAGYEAHGERMNIFHAKATIGSFKLINFRGRGEIEFQGTVMVNNYKPRIAGQNVQFIGAFTKEFEDKGLNRVVMHGKGKLIIDGEVRGVQLFGRGINCWFYGAGTFRNRGEFDKNLYLGEWWFDDASKKEPWGNGATIDVLFPRPKAGQINDPNKPVIPKKRGG